MARRAGPHALVVTLLLVLAIWEFWAVWGEGSGSSTVLCQCGDPGQAVWFMAWVPWAIAHGHNPFYSDVIYSGKGGINLLQSTSYMLPSFVLTPVTWLFGPTASFNLAETLAPVLSGWCMFAAVRRVSRRLAGQVVAALLWGFSPVMWGAQIYGHLNFAVLFFPPLVFALLFDLFAASRRSPQRIGIELGLLTVAEFFTGTEALAVTACAAVIGCVTAVVLAPRGAWEIRRRVVVAFGVAVALAGLLLAYPLWWLLAGPRHITGEPWPLTSWYGSGLGAIVRPGAAHRPTVNAEVGGYFGNVGPPFAYLGLGLLSFIAISGFVWWRKRLAWVLVVTALVCWDFSLGVVILPFTAGSAPWWLGWARFQYMPLLQSIGPSRFSLAVTGCAAVLVAISVDAWSDLAASVAHRRRPGDSEAPEAASRRVAGVVSVVALLAMVPIAASYTWPLTMNMGVTPEWFWKDAPHLDPRTVLLTYPYASSGSPLAMYWQAVDGFPFRLVGGRAEVPGGDGRQSAHVVPFTGSELYLQDTSYGLGVPAPPTLPTLRMLRQSIKGWGVDEVVVVRRGRAPGWAVAMYTLALGREPRVQDGAYLWTDIAADLASDKPLTVDPAWFDECVGTGLDPSQIAATVACVASRARPAR